MVMQWLVFKRILFQKFSSYFNIQQINDPDNKKNAWQDKRNTWKRYSKKYNTTKQELLNKSYTNQMFWNLF